MAATDDISPEQIDEALAVLPDWRYHEGALVTVYKMPTSAVALELIAAVGRVAEEQNHHPDLDWRYNRVFLRFSSHDVGGEVTTRDTRGGGGVSEAAAAVHAVAEPACTKHPARRFRVWRALTGRAGSGKARGPHGRPGQWKPHGQPPALDMSSKPKATAASFSAAIGWWSRSRDPAWRGCGPGR
jgi:4a-hydroxytetrahydrobiopterin dehydratase